MFKLFSFGKTKKLESALRRVRKLAYESPQMSPDKEAVQYMNICTAALGDEETSIRKPT